MNENIENIEDVVEVTVPTLSKAETELQLRIKDVLNTATDADREFATELSASGAVPRQVTITPVVAAIVVAEHNKVNRSLNISKVNTFSAAINRGEWKMHHQGIAFYADSTLADGQHRLHAAALSDKSIELMVYSDFPRGAIDAIDRSTTRWAYEALEMSGVKDAKTKAGVGKRAMDYLYRLEHAAVPRFTDQQIEKWVMNNEPIISSAIHIGEHSVEAVADAPLSKNDAKTIALLMLLGSWGPQVVAGFLASIQQGVATYPESPTSALSKLYLRAKINSRKVDRITPFSRLALALKGATLWAEEKSVARMTWNQKREGIPSNTATINEQA